MAIYIVDVSKLLQGTLQSWGNRYLINAGDLTEAASAAPIIVAAERAFHSESVEFTQARVATLAANDGLYLTLPQAGNGSRPVDGNVAPIQCCVRVDFQVSGFGRPSRKFYHTGCGTNEIDPGQRWETAVLADTDAAVAQLISDLGDNGTFWVDPQGQEVIQQSVKGLIAYHQFTKASKRNTGP